MGIFYQGIERQWFDIVYIFILTSEGAFILSTIVNLIFCRKIKVIRIFSIVSLAMIIAAFIPKFMGVTEYPAIISVILYFYAWFYYGLMLSKKWCDK